MKKFKIFAGIASLILAFGVASCGVTSIKDSTTAETTESIETTTKSTTTKTKATTTTKESTTKESTTKETTTKDTTTATTSEDDFTPDEVSLVGKSGGVVTTGENLTLNIPSGALDKNTEIAMAYVMEESEISNKMAEGFLGGAIFGPSGTVFNTPVEAKLKISEELNNEEISIFCYSEEYDMWEYVTSATVTGNVATFSITHFSKYEALKITPEMLLHYESLVYQAKNENKSDAWITETYRDYLVNEHKVLERYKEFLGYWYEPVGLSIHGMYDLDGDEGKGDDLSYFEGEHVKVGDTLGLAVQGSLDSVTQVSTYDYIKKKMQNPDESQKFIFVTVTIEYKPIVPTITLSAANTKLNVGDTEEVSLHVYYDNPDNELYPHFDIPGCPINLTGKFEAFTVERKDHYTNDSGKITFDVTCVKGGKEEIKANYDVPDDILNTHAEGSITFENNDYLLNAHVKEVYKADYTKGDMGTTVQRGSFDITLEYDLEGSIKNEDGNISGTIQVMNVALTISCVDNIYNVPIEDIVAIYHLVPFATTNIQIENNQEFMVSGSIGENNILAISASGEAEIASSTGSGYVRSISDLFGTIEVDISHVLQFTLSGEKLLPSFEFIEGTQTISLEELKDDLAITFSNGEETSNGVEVLGANAEVNETKTTEITITISLPTKEE